MMVFRREETELPEKNLRRKTKINNKLNPHIATYCTRPESNPIHSGEGVASDWLYSIPFRDSSNTLSSLMLWKLACAPVGYQLSL